MISREEAMSRLQSYLKSDSPVDDPYRDIVTWGEDRFWVPDALDRETLEPLDIRGTIVFTPHQKTILRFMFDPLRPIMEAPQTLLYSTPKKEGKALALNTVLPTPDGWTTMGELQSGDLLFDDNGDICRVVYITEIMYGHTCFTVQFSDGEEIIADAGHLWNVEVLAKQYASCTLTTREMVSSLERGDGAKNYRVFVANALKLPPLQYPVHPYVLGVWLGDGDSAGARITKDALGDIEVIDYLREYETVKQLADQKNRATTWLVGSGGRSQDARNHSLTARLRGLGVIENKHIPTAYLRGSYEQRLALVQGLMDTDGYIDNFGKQCEFSTTREELAYGMMELLRTLAIKPFIRERRAMLYGRDCGPAWRITFHAPSEIPVFRLRRKRDLQKPSVGSSRRSQNRHIIAITPVESVPVRCIQVDSPSHLYLIGESMLPTHNTAIAAVVGRWEAEMGGDYADVIMVGNDEAQARSRIYETAIRSMELDPAFDRQRRELMAPDGSTEWRIIRAIGNHIPNYGKIRPIALDYRGEAGANPVASVWCVDQETEILTDNGWRTWETFEVGRDRVATRNPETGAFEWQIARAVSITDFDGELHTAQGLKINMALSPRHRLWGTPEGGTTGFHRVENILTKRFSFPDSFTSWEGEATTVPEDFPCDASLEIYAEFLGWFLSEGSLHTGHQTVILAQKPSSPFYKQVQDCIRKLGHEPGLWASNDCVLAIYNKKLLDYCTPFGKQDQRFVPRALKNAPVDILRIFFETYVRGDGTLEQYGSKTRFKIGTISRQMRDDLEEIGLKLGYWVSSSEGYDARSRFPQYVVRFYEGNGHVQHVRPNHWKRTSYKGKVWCPSTPNGIITVRRGGRVYQTGNTEVWGADQEKARRLFDEMTPPPTKQNAIRFLEGYAGFEGESLLWRQLWDMAQKDGRRVLREELEPYGGWPFEDDPPIWVNPAARMVAYIDQGVVARRMPWKWGERGRQYYAAQEATERPDAYRRLHLNEWVSSITEFIPSAWWDACENRNLPLIPKDWPIVLGADAAVTGDCAAIVGVCRDPTNLRNIRVLFARIWTPTPGHPLDYGAEGGLEDELRRMCAQYNVAQIAYDPYQLHRTMSQFMQEGIAWCRPFNQMAERARGDKQLYDIIRDRRIVHPGLPDLSEHIKNAAAKHAPDEDTRLRIIKKSQSGKIDSAVALSMACSECLRLNLV